ncbi:sulfotransferase domain-containing protein [Kordiimonas aestuarii]|uniref:sulfotransferase domain-containing protein n=1 Tax=Kordiimonas aestuarii TaxID=1005925 RepID=UPI0021D2B51F|nr:sulfotransferase domain-containing protein [Kordiimonas aestuarii]
MLVICSGMMRSGSTLQYNLTRETVEASGRGRGEGYFDAYDLEAYHRKVESWICDDVIHVLKSHDLPKFIVDQSKNPGLFIIYVHRDLRDVARSLMRKFPKAENQLFKDIDDALEVYLAATRCQNVIMQKFDDLMHDKKRAVQEIANFIGIALHKDLTDRIMHTTSPEASQLNVGVANASKTLAMKRFLYGVNSRVRIMPLIKKVLPHYLSARLRRALYPNDAKTLMHSKHISDKSHTEFDINALLIKKISIKYASWQKENGYVDFTL